jgi:hypothetical protein
MCGLVNCTLTQRCDPNTNQCVCQSAFGGPLCDWPRFQLNNSVPFAGFVSAGNQSYYELLVTKAVSLLSFQMIITTGAPVVRSINVAVSPNNDKLEFHLDVCFACNLSYTAAIRLCQLFGVSRTAANRYHISTDRNVFRSRLLATASEQQFHADWHRVVALSERLLGQRQLSKWCL